LVLGRLHLEATRALALGQIDTAGCDVGKLIASAAGLVAPTLPAPQPVMRLCADTAQLVRDAMRPWSPGTHGLFHLRFRRGVGAVLLVAHRLDYDAGRRRSLRRRLETTPSRLPPMIWRSILSFLLRRDWSTGQRGST